MRKIGVITVLYDSHNWSPMAVGDDMINIVVDNTPLRDLGPEFYRKKELKYIPLKKNHGIAYAQNVGISEAIESGCQYVVFFDQDSVADGNLVRTLCKRFEAHRDYGTRIGAIGPALYECDTNRRYKSQIIAEVEEGETYALISSGMFTSLDVIEEVGMMENKLFIDLVDTEWCMRCRSHGYRIYMTNHCSIKHKVGEASTVFMGFPIISSASQRYYYKYRNTMLLLRRSYVPMNWKMKTLLRSIITFLIVPFFGLFKGRRINVMKNMAMGICDSFKYRGLKNEK